MKKVLVSSCLLGEPVRYDATSLFCEHEFLRSLTQKQQIIAICPEVMGGLSIPRPAAEIIHDRVINILEVDVTDAFNEGAERVLDIAQKHQIKMAILKARSPSCGNIEVYDGRFRGQIRKGEGVTAAILIQNGIMVFNEHQLDEARIYYLNLVN